MTSSMGRIIQKNMEHKIHVETTNQWWLTNGFRGDFSSSLAAEHPNGVIGQ